MQPKILTEEELRIILDECYDKIRDSLANIIVMNRMHRPHIELKCSSDRFGTYHDVDTTYLNDDCIQLCSMFEFTEEVLKIEEHYFNLIFGNFKYVYDSWEVAKIKNNHFLISLAILFNEKKHYKSVLSSYVYKCYEIYPINFEYRIMNGQELLEINLRNYFYTNREFHRQWFSIFVGDYKIKKTKWYVIRRNDRYLLGNQRYLGFFNNVTVKGLKTKSEAIGMVEELKLNGFESIERRSFSYCHHCIGDFEIF